MFFFISIGIEDREIDREKERRGDTSSVQSKKCLQEGERKERIEF